MSRKVKRLPKEVQEMVNGGTALLQIMSALVAAIVRKGGTASQIHALAKAEGAAMIERMADAFFGAMQTGVKCFPTWKVIALGTHKTAFALREAVTSSGSRISDWASQLLAKTPLATQETTIELVQVTGAQLGQTGNENLDQICARAKSRSLDRCPAEVGPQLRRQHADQPMNEVVYVAMDPIAGADGDPGVFHVLHDGDDRWLGANYARPDDIWYPGAVWVFVRSKQ